MLFHCFEEPVGKRWTFEQRADGCHVFGGWRDQVPDGVAVRSAAPPKGNTMKTALIAGLMAFTSFAALAQSGNGETWGQNLVPSGDPLTRSQVVAELQQAQANREIAFGEFSPGKIEAAPASARSRSEVRDEVMAMRNAGRHPARGELSTDVL